MDCKQFRELISAAVDLQLTGGEMAAFGEHKRVCSPCRYEFEAEAATKSIVGLRVRYVPTPEHVTRQIISSLQSDRSASTLQWLLELLKKPLVKPAIVFCLAFASVLILLRDSTSDIPLSQASLASNDIILQSLKNHGAILSGEIKPQVMSSEPAQMESLFAGITDYAVHMPRMKDCKLVGGVQNEYAGTKLAHLVYQRNGEIVYVYQTCLATVMKGEKLCLSDAAKDGLVQTGWFTESEPDGRAVVLWIRGRTLCAAVARMNKEDLVTCLTSDDGHR